MNNKSNTVSRRKFIGDAAALSTLGAIGMGAIVTSCSRKKYSAPVFLDRAPDGPVLKAGLVGCGSRGTGAAINFVDAGPNLQITALGDLFDHRLNRCRDELKENRGIEVEEKNCFLGFDAYKKVIDSGVDVVLLCQPTHFRPMSFEYAIQARKHVFAEKPIAVDPVGVRSVMASGRMAEAAGLNVVVGTQRRHQHDYLKTFEMVKNGAIGDIVSANCYWNQGRMWHVDNPPQEGWSDMESMIRDWVNWSWLCGDHILDLHIHNIDVVNWFFEKHPVKAVSFGGRHRLTRGNQFDFFSTDFELEDGRRIHSMTRQIDGCVNNVSEIIYGTKGFTNARNRIVDYKGNLIWQYRYPVGADGQPTNSVAISPYIQEHINLITAIRSNGYINETQNICESNLAGIMARESAYSGRQVTWDEMMSSNSRLGPTEYKMGPVDTVVVPRQAPVPGTSS
jgi:myo-inositol 2-dehydrogenase / D-chiro-inositol 1-dehydrogenase